MNIFYTNPNSYICASDHCKTHVNKMIIEYSQLLSSAHHKLDGGKDGICKLTHQNHPCAIWVRHSLFNYKWLLNTLHALHNIYEIEKGREHGCIKYFNALCSPPRNISKNEFVDPPKCMPDEFKVESTTESYQNYLNAKFKEWAERNDKRKIFVSWFAEVTPHWYKK